MGKSDRAGGGVRKENQMVGELKTDGVSLGRKWGEFVVRLPLLGVGVDAAYIYILLQSVLVDNSCFFSFKNFKIT